MKIPREAESSSKPIFISHAATDKAIADRVVDLLNTAMGIDVQKAVFCTSLEGMKIPPGKDFKDFVKDQIQEPQIVVLLISQNYFASQFCLAELGASWAMSHRIIPFLIPPVTFDDMKAVLTGVHALRIEDAAEWNEAFAVFREILKIDPNVNRWERKRDEHLESIVQLIKSQKPPPIVPLSKLAAAEKKLQAANEEICNFEQENQRLAKLVNDLKKAKDQTEVSRIEIESMSESDALEELVNDAVKTMEPLPRVAREALYYHFRGELLEWPGFGGDAQMEDMKAAVENEYVVDRGNGVSVNEEDPIMGEAHEALSQVRDFIRGASGEFSAAYARENGHQLSFSSRRFWDAELL